MADLMRSLAIRHFLADSELTSMLGEPYRDWLEPLQFDASSNADLVTLFFLRAFDSFKGEFLV